MVMNERIQKLAEQALTQCCDENGFYGQDKQFRINPTALAGTEVFQVFGELIVRECAKFSYKYTSNEKNVQDYKEVGWDCLPRDLLNAMHDHFGVKL